MGGMLTCAHPSDKRKCLNSRVICHARRKYQWPVQKRYFARTSARALSGADAQIYGTLR
jgi:hypothetical protein